MGTSIGHGGARPGAGRPRGGMSQARRVLNAAMERAFAGDIAGELEPEAREEQAIRGAAQEAANMILAGYADRVLAIWASVAPKQDEGGGDNPARSALLGALEAMPGRDTGPNPAHQVDEGDGGYGHQATEAAGATDTQSGGRRIEPPRGPAQVPLLAAGRAPHPPLAASARSNPVSSENFEKNPCYPVYEGQLA